MLSTFNHGIGGGLWNILRDVMASRVTDSKLKIQMIWMHLFGLVGLMGTQQLTNP